jgi:phosphoglycerate dehydrogenase-like enzyme
MPSVRVLHHTRAEMIEPLRAEFPDVEFVPVPTDGEVDPSIQGDVLLTSVIGAPTLTEVLGRGVRWVHTAGTGVDRFPMAAIRDGQVLTCSRGASAIPIAEWCVAVMLAHAKKLPESWIHEPPEPPRRWHMAELQGLRGSRLGVLGMGAIGLETARLALAFGMDVRGLRRTPRPAPVDGIEIVTTAQATVDGADHVVIAAPLTPETRHLVDASLLAAMKPGVHLVNIARGQLIDDDALRAALDSNHVAMASLDAVTPEPLPEGHWMYTHPRVRLSPHISWSMPGSFESLYDTFRQNLRRFQRGEPLEGIVDIVNGY